MRELTNTQFTNTVVILYLVSSISHAASHPYWECGEQWKCWCLDWDGTGLTGEQANLYLYSLIQRRHNCYSHFVGDL